MPSSHTRNISILKPPVRERLLLDADITPPIEFLLRINGFRTESVLRIDEIDETDDIAVIRYARAHRMIVVCFDMHDDHRTKLAWNTEIVMRGGQAIQIAEGPGQPAEMAIGKMLLHYRDWKAHFAEHQHGVATLSRSNCRFATQEILRQRTPRARSERDFEIQMRALGTRRRKGSGRPGRGGRPRPNPTAGDRLL